MQVAEAKQSKNTVSKVETGKPGLFFQPKLTVNDSGDEYEQEADAMADKIMRMPANDQLFFSPKPLSISRLQRKCQHCEEEEKLQRKEDDEEDQPVQPKPIKNFDVQRKCSACEADEKLIHRKEDDEDDIVQMKPITGLIQRDCAACEQEDKKIQSKLAPGFIQKKCAACGADENKIYKKQSANTPLPPLTPSVHQVLNSNGQSMDKNTRSFMEQRFGYDFGNVRIHNDSTSHKSSKEIDALAYTHGEHIVFGNGEYQPGTEAGKRLLAHELTHVLQQAPRNSGQISLAQKTSAQTIQRKDHTIKSLFDAYKCDPKKEDPPKDEPWPEDRRRCGTVKFNPPVKPTTLGTATATGEQTCSNSETTGTQNQDKDNPPPQTTEHSGEQTCDNSETIGTQNQDKDKSICDMLFEKWLNDLFGISKDPPVPPENTKFKSKKKESPLAKITALKNKIFAITRPAASVQQQGDQFVQQPKKQESKDDLTLGSIKDVVKKFASSPFNAKNIPVNRLSKLDQLYGSTIKSKSDDVSFLIDQSKLGLTDIDLHGQQLKQSLLVQNISLSHLQNRHTWSAKKAILRQYTEALEAISKDYLSITDDINFTYTEKITDHAVRVERWKATLGEDNTKYEDITRNDFSKATGKARQEGYNWAFLANSKANWVADDYELGIIAREVPAPDLDKKTAAYDVRHVQNAEWDSTFKGPLTYDKYNARASAAREVGKAYEKSIKEQSDEFANTLDCSLDKTIGFGSTMTEKYKTEIDCLHILTTEALNAEKESQLQIAAQGYNSYLEGVNNIMLQGFAMADINHTMFNFSLKELYKEQASSIEKNNDLAINAFMVGTGNIAISLFGLLESFCDDLEKNSGANEQELLGRRSEFEKNWDFHFKEQYGSLNTGFSTLNHDLNSAYRELSTFNNGLESKGNEKNRAIVDSMSRAFKLTLKDEGKYFESRKKCYHETLDCSYKNAVCQLDSFGNNTVNSLLTAFPETNRKNLDHQIYCFKYGIYKSLNENFNKSICIYGEKAAAEQKPLWKTQVKWIAFVIVTVATFGVAAMLIKGGIMAVGFLIALGETGAAIIVGAATIITIAVVSGALAAFLKLTQNFIDDGFDNITKDVLHEFLIGAALGALGALAEFAITLKTGASLLFKFLTLNAVFIGGVVIHNVIYHLPITPGAILFGVALGWGMILGFKVLGKAIDLWKGWRANPASVVVESELKNLNQQVEQQSEGTSAGENNAPVKGTADTITPAAESATVMQPNDPVTDTARGTAAPTTVEPVAEQTHEPSQVQNRGEPTAGKLRTPDPIPTETATEPPAGSAATPDQAVSESGAVPDEVGSSRVDELRERAESAKNEAIDNRNDISELEREIRELKRSKPRPGRAAEINEARETLKAAKRNQANLDRQQELAEKAYTDSTKPLVDRLHAESEKLDAYKNTRKDSNGIDEISKRKSGNIHTDHLVSLKRISLLRGATRLAEVRFQELLEIANMDGNLKAMDGAANSSKGEMSWKEWGGRAKEFGYTQDMIDEMIKLEDIMEARIQNAIDMKLAPRFKSIIPTGGTTGIDIGDITTPVPSVHEMPAPDLAPSTVQTPEPVEAAGGIDIQQHGPIEGKPGSRHAPVGGGHEIVEVEDSSMPSGVACELHSPPPFLKIPCPPGMGSKNNKESQPATTDPVPAGNATHSDYTVRPERPKRWLVSLGPEGTPVMSPAGPRRTVPEFTPTAGEEPELEGTTAAGVEDFTGPWRLQTAPSNEASLAAAHHAGIPSLISGDATVLTRADFPDILPEQPTAIGRPAPEGLDLERPIGGSRIQNAEVQQDIDVLRQAGATDFRVNQRQTIEDLQGGTNRPDLSCRLGGRRLHIEYDRFPMTRAMEHARRILTNDPDAIVILKGIDYDPVMP